MTIAYPGRVSHAKFNFFLPQNEEAALDTLNSVEPWLEQWPVSILTLLVIVLGVYLYRKLPKSIVPLTLSVIAICQVIQVVHLIYSL